MADLINTESHQRWMELASHKRIMKHKKAEVHEIFINTAKELVNLMRALPAEVANISARSYSPLLVAHAEIRVAALNEQIAEARARLAEWRAAEEVYNEDIDTVSDVMASVAAQDFQQVAQILADNTKVFIVDGSGADAVFTFEEGRPVFNAMGNTYESPTALYQAFYGACSSTENLCPADHWHSIMINSGEYDGKRLSEIFAVL